MAFEEDFVSGPKDFEVEGRKFKIKILSGGDFDNVASEFVFITDGILTIDVPKKNEAFLRECVLDAPYEKNGKPFATLTKEERTEILQKLRPTIRTKLLRAIMVLNEMPEEAKKNLKKTSSQDNSETLISKEN